MRKPVSAEIEKNRGILRHASVFKVLDRLHYIWKARFPTEIEMNAFIGVVAVLDKRISKLARVFLAVVQVEDSVVQVIVYADDDCIAACFDLLPQIRDVYLLRRILRERGGRDKKQHDRQRVKPEHGCQTAPYRSNRLTTNAAVFHICSLNEGFAEMATPKTNTVAIRRRDVGDIIA